MKAYVASPLGFTESTKLYYEQTVFRIFPSLDDLLAAVSEVQRT